MTNKLKLWRDKFGDDYTERNQLSEEVLKARNILWANTLQFLISPTFIPNSYLEIGAGVGANLLAIREIYIANGRVPELYAVEPNDKAKVQLELNVPVKILDGSAFCVDTQSGDFDVVFTSGVLIHIHPDDQLKAMKEIYRLSKKFIICIEYFSPVPRELEYHGEKALWTNDYGSMWLDNFKLRSVSYAFYWKRVTGLDNVTAWIFEKVH